MGKAKILGKKNRKILVSFIVVAFILLGLEVFAYLKTGDVEVTLEYSIKGNSYSAKKEITIIDCPNGKCEDGETLDNCLEDCRIKYMPNLSITPTVKPFIALNKTEQVSLKIANYGLWEASNITISFYENQTLLKSELIKSLGSSENYALNFTYKPKIRGDKNLKFVIGYYPSLSNITVSAVVNVYALANLDIKLFNYSGGQKRALLDVNGKLSDILNSSLNNLPENSVINLTILNAENDYNISSVFKDLSLKENANLSFYNYINLNVNNTMLYKVYAYKTDLVFSKLVLRNVPPILSFKDKSGPFSIYTCKFWNFSYNLCQSRWEEKGFSNEKDFEAAERIDAVGFGGSDYDGDGLIDTLDDDKDNDGINDSLDKIYCKYDKIYDLSRNATFKLSENKNLLSDTFQKLLEIAETGKTIIEVKLDLKGSKVECKNPSISKDKKENRNFLIVKGLDISNSTKNVYLDASVNSTNRSMICLKDQEIDSISEVSENCNGQNEFILKCDGTSKNNYNCTFTGQSYKVSGLSHSAVIELGPCKESWSCNSWSSCVNGTQTRICTDKNDCGTNLSKPADNQGCNETITLQSNQSSTFKSLFVCNMDWKCGDWSACANNVQARKCEFANVSKYTSNITCPAQTNQPETTQKCQAIVKPAEKTETCFDNIKNQNEIDVDCGGICKVCQAKGTCFDGIKNQNEEGVDCGGICKVCKNASEQQTKPDKIKTPVVGYIIIGTILASIILTSAVYVIKAVNKKAKASAKLANLENYIRKNLAMGYRKEQIRQKVLEAGWKEDVVNNILRRF